MPITSYYPVLASADVAAAHAFFARLFGFEPRFVCDWYVHLSHPRHPSVEVALVAKDHPTIPAAGRVAAAGLLLNFEVDDVDAEYQRLCAAGAEVLIPIRDEEFGQRHFILQGPDGVLIDVIKPIAPTTAYADAYCQPTR